MPAPETACHAQYSDTAPVQEPASEEVLPEYLAEQLPSSLKWSQAQATQTSIPAKGLGQQHGMLWNISKEMIPSVGMAEALLWRWTELYGKDRLWSGRVLHVIYIF